MKTLFKDKIKQTFCIVKGELYLNFPIWLIQLIISSSIMLFIGLICFFMKLTVYDKSMIFYNFQNNSDMFVEFSTIILIFIGQIFSIVYVAKSLSYLSNKRKLDLYGSMPIARQVFFSGKLIASYIQSVMVVAVLGVIVVGVGALTGATFNNNEIQHLVNYIFYTLFVIAFYGLCASCSKSAVSAVVSYFIVSFSIPAAVAILRGVLIGFFIGINPYVIPDESIYRIFNLLTDTSLIYILYWVLISICCVLVANIFVKRRNTENTRRMIVVPLLEYIIKISLTIIAGTITGLLIGAIAIDNGAVGFIAGFLVASIPVYIVIHIIYNNGFSKIISSGIVLGALIIVSVTSFLIGDANPMLNNNVPNADEVASVGFIDTEQQFKKIGAGEILDSRNDFAEKEDIEKIIELHSHLAEKHSIVRTTSKKIQNVWTHYLESMIRGIANIPDEKGFMITYQYKNGLVNSYYYSEKMEYYFSDNIWVEKITETDDTVSDIIAELEATDVYCKNHRPIYTLDSSSFSRIFVRGYDDKYASSVYWDENIISRSEDEEKFENCYNELSEALKTDLENDKNRVENNKPLIYTVLNTEKYHSAQPTDKIIVTFSNENAYSDLVDEYYVPQTYTTTLEVLKKYNAVKDAYTVNKENYKDTIDAIKTY